MGSARGVIAQQVAAWPASSKTMTKQLQAMDRAIHAEESAMLPPANSMLASMSPRGSKGLASTAPTSISSARGAVGAGRRQTNGVGPQSLSAR